jgi:hypothetical protein
VAAVGEVEAGEAGVGEVVEAGTTPTGTRIPTMRLPGTRAEMRTAIGPASGPRGKAALCNSYVPVYWPLGRRSVEYRCGGWGIMYYLCHFIEVTDGIMSFFS